MGVSAENASLLRRFFMSNLLWYDYINEKHYYPRSGHGSTVGAGAHGSD